ncbi:MAG: hypothetical protein HQL62_02460 [Magnetococcales bacterium]|nr:hypothetical protein [Magnetococcales bacterium]
MNVHPFGCESRVNNCQASKQGNDLHLPTGYGESYHFPRGMEPNPQTHGQETRKE